MVKSVTKIIPYLNLGGQQLSTQSMVESNHTLGKKNYSYRDGQFIFVSETGLASGLPLNKQEFKTQIEKWIVDIKYGQNSGLMDIFSFSL